MYELLSEWPRVEGELGYTLRDHFLMPVRTMDNPRYLAPMILKRGERRWGIFQGVERGNVEALTLPTDLRVVYCRPYITFDTLESDRRMPRNLGEALQGIVDPVDKLVVDGHLPVAAWAELAPHFRVGVAPGSDLEGEVAVLAVPREQVVGPLAEGRPRAGEAALRLLVRSPIREEIASYLEPRPDTRFEALDRLLARDGLSALVASSRVNLQELAGVPPAASEPRAVVLYSAGGPHAYLVEPAQAGVGRRYPSARTALADLAPAGKLGVETEDLGVGAFRALGLDGRDTVPADLLLREWRDTSAVLDAAYYVIAGRASVAAIEGALAWAEAAVRGGRWITERDVDAVYLRALDDYVTQTGLPIRATRFMTNHHCGTRTLYPAHPTDYPIDRDVNTLKIDAGCLLFDLDGYLLGCSDIARTLAFTEEGREICRLQEHGVRDVMIPAARVGAVAEEVFSLGLDALWSARTSAGSQRLFPDVPSLVEVYRRDVGHLLGKNDLSYLSFRQGDRGRLMDGMVACLEYQWPIAGHSIAVEDTCVVTPRGGLNFTYDPS